MRFLLPEWEICQRELPRNEFQGSDNENAKEQTTYQCLKPDVR